MSMISAVELSVAPWVGLAIVGITALRLNGCLSDELMGELQKPFSRATLTAVCVLTVLVGQVCWIGSQF